MHNTYIVILYQCKSSHITLLLTMLLQPIPNNAYLTNYCIEITELVLTYTSYKYP